MKIKLIKFFLLVFILSFPILSHAFFSCSYCSGVYFAPYLGQVVNGSLASSPSNPPDPTEPNEAKYDTSGLRYGVQLGYTIGNFVFGIDGSYGNLNYQYNSPDGVTVPDSKIGISQYGGFIMYRGRKVVPWLGALIEVSAKDNKQDFEFQSGSGLQVGLGFKLYRWLQLNFEVRTYSFTKLFDRGFEIDLPSSSRKEFLGSEFLIGLSFPFEFQKNHKSR